MEPASRKADGQEMTTFAAGGMGGSLARDSVLSGNVSAVSEVSYTAIDAPPIHDGTTRNFSGESSQNSSTIVQSTNTINAAGESSQNVSAIVQSAHSNPVGISMFQG